MFPRLSLNISFGRELGRACARLASRSLAASALLALALLNCSGASISSFDPTVGSPGDIVFIYGSGFYPSTTVTVKYNGITDPTASPIAVDGTSIQSQVPAGATTGSISVKVDNGAAAFSGQPFTVVGPGPYVTNFNPTAGSSGLGVTIKGIHFASGHATNAYFNGKAGVSFFASDDNTIQVTTPPGVTTGPISVRGTLGTNTTAANFFAPPVITGFTPFNGRTGTNVTVTGTNFIGTTAVSFGGVSASAFTVLSNNALNVTVPPSALTGPIQIFAPGGSFPTSSNFVVQPVIYGFSPTFGAAGTTVTISGANLAGVSSVKFGGVAATFSGASFGQVSGVVPAAAPSGPITVTTPDGTFQSSANFYLPPQLTSFAPNHGVAGTLVGITGVNLTNASSVTFNGTPASAFYVTNNTSLGAVVPVGFSSGPIAITTPGGGVTSGSLFYGVPGIISFNPTHGLPGTNVTITGTNLLGVTSVQFNGVNASFVAPLNNTTFSATVPATAQTGPIRIAAPGGTNVSAQNFILDYNADLSVTLNDAPDPVFIGSNLVYTITVFNSGPFDATNVRVTNYLPATASLRSFTLTQGSTVSVGNPFAANFGTIPMNGSAVLTLTVAPQVVGSISNFVSVTSDLSDLTTGNNSASALTFVLPLPSLSISVLPARKLQLSWPVELTNFLLQYNNSAPNTVFWSNNLTVPTISGNQRTVLDTNWTPNRFYRLKD